jgi:hypothetical protein
MWAIGLKTRSWIRIPLSLAVKPVAVKCASAGLGHQPGEIPTVLWLQRNRHRGSTGGMPGATFKHHLDVPTLRGPDPKMDASAWEHLRPHRQPPVLPEV